MWGRGVTALIEVTAMPWASRDLMAASLPAPEPLTNTSTSRRPCSLPFRAASSAARWAAKAVDFREPLKPAVPALPQQTTAPDRSVMVTMVLLKVDCM